ncbi:hypothetical protein B0T09DRAFT_87609 [Sordaria sp. MPI-SDFR-AT-0083]|nr:hypothetical protein B0T09DRAFT_87609 [Sordaria sp. MPI-SDFR-AT-0083]
MYQAHWASLALWAVLTTLALGQSCQSIGNLNDDSTIFDRNGNDTHSHKSDIRTRSHAHLHASNSHTNKRHAALHHLSPRNSSRSNIEVSYQKHSSRDSGLQVDIDGDRIIYWHESALQSHVWLAATKDSKPVGALQKRAPTTVKVINTGLTLPDCAGCAAKNDGKPLKWQEWDWKEMKQRMLPEAASQLDNTCLFYTGIPPKGDSGAQKLYDKNIFGQSALATTLACKMDLKSIWVCFNSNARRCIMLPFSLLLRFDFSLYADAKTLRLPRLPRCYGPDGAKNMKIQRPIGICPTITKSKKAAGLRTVIIQLTEPSIDGNTLEPCPKPWPEAAAVLSASWFRPPKALAIKCTHESGCSTSTQPCVSSTIWEELRG